MNISLQRYCDALAERLLKGPQGTHVPLPAGADDTLQRCLDAQPQALAIYRNNLHVAWVDALQANFPRVVRMTGQEWFRAAARTYAQQHAESDPRLIFYGVGFPDFLSRFAPAQDTPYLAGIARLDRAWLLAHTAADAPAMDSAGLHALSEAACNDEPICLRMHPAAHWIQDAQHPIATLWQRCMAQQDEDQPLEWQPEALLFTRPQWQVQWLACSAATCVLLRACADGLPLEVAAQRALESDPSLDLAATLQQLVQCGALSARDSQSPPAPC